MVQYYLDLERQIKKFKDTRLEGGQIQKIYSTAFYVSMAIRTPGKTWFLYLGRGGGHEGLWIHDAPPAPELRKKDHYLEYLRRHLSSCAVLDLVLDSKDRIIKLDYQKFGRRQSLLLFWKARKLYFVHYFQESPEAPFKLLLSWRGRAVIPPEEVTDLFGAFDEIGRTELKRESGATSVEMPALLEQELKVGALKALSSRPSFLARKKQNIQADLERARDWQKIQHVLNEAQDLDGYELKIGEQKIKFEGELNPYERRNLLFERIKKLRRGETILTARLKEVEEQLGEKGPKVAQETTLHTIKPVWGKEEAKIIQEAKDSRAEYRVFKSENIQIGVGDTSHGNDQLRSKWATKDDTWFHLDGQKSAHVIVKVLRGSLDNETMATAASILAYFSHFSGDWIPVIFTQVKNLKGVTGSPGMVIFKKEKHLSCPRIDISTWLKEGL